MSKNKMVLLSVCFIFACRERTYNQDADVASVTPQGQVIPTCVDGEALLEVQRIRNTWYDMIADPASGLNMQAEIPNFRNPVTRTWDCCALGPVSVCRMHHEMAAKGILWINYKMPKTANTSALLPKITVNLNGVEKTFPVQPSQAGINYFLTNGMIQCTNTFEREELHTKCSESAPEFKDLFKNAFLKGADSGDFSPWKLKLTFSKRTSDSEEGVDVFNFKLDTPNLPPEYTPKTLDGARPSPDQTPDDSSTDFEEAPGKL